MSDKPGKICRKCKLHKKLVEFGYSKRYRDFRSPYCIQCRRERLRQHRLTQKQRILLHRMMPVAPSPAPVLAVCDQRIVQPLIDIFQQIDEMRR